MEKQLTSTTCTTEKGKAGANAPWLYFLQKMTEGLKIYLNIYRGCLLVIPTSIISFLA